MRAQSSPSLSGGRPVVDSGWIPLQDGQLWAIPKVEANRLADLPGTLVHAIADVRCPVVSPADFQGPTDEDVIAG